MSMQNCFTRNKLQTYLKCGKIAGRAPKKHAKLKNLIVYSDKGQFSLE